MNLFLFVTTILIWGSTWIAISLQVGDVPLIVSVFYRFAIAAALFVPLLAAMGRLGSGPIKGVDASGIFAKYRWLFARRE